MRVETLIQYLLLDAYGRRTRRFRGGEVRDVARRCATSATRRCSGTALRSGLIDTVATDHAPFDFQRQKTMGRDDFTKIPNGIPALEDRVNLLFTHGVKTGRIDLHTFVDVASTQRRPNLRPVPAQGHDPAGRGRRSRGLRSGIIAARSRRATQTMNLDYSAFEGWPIEGRPERGDGARRGGRARRPIRRHAGPGKFLARQPGRPDAESLQRKNAARRCVVAGREGFDDDDAEGLRSRMG